MIEIQEATKSQAAEIARLIMIAMTDDCKLGSQGSYQVADGERYVVNEVLWGESQLHTALTSRDVDFLMHQTGLVDIGGERFLHANRTTATTDIACQRQQFLLVNGFARLITAGSCCLLQVHLTGTRHHTHEMLGLVALQSSSRHTFVFCIF